MLRSSFSPNIAPDSEGLLERLGMGPQARAEELAVGDFCRIANALRSGAPVKLGLQFLHELPEAGEPRAAQPFRGLDRVHRLDRAADVVIDHDIIILVPMLNLVAGGGMLGASNEIQHWDEYDYVVINHDIGCSVEAVRAILAAERLRRTRLTGLKQFVKKLQTEL